MKHVEGSLEMNIGRTREFARDKSLEDVLTELNSSIESISPPYCTPKYPPIFVMGVPRCGSTLMLQWLASLGVFAYPTNLIARYYGNPYLGALSQKALVDCDNSNQIGLHDSASEFTSALGKTHGASSPSEFWYFWRRFFKFGDIQVLDGSDIPLEEQNAFLEGVAGLEAVFNMPVALKGMILNWHIPLLHKVCPNAIFVNVERDDFFNAQSLFFARQRFFGDEHKWFSYKPPEYAHLKDLSPIQQVAGQVYYTKKALTEGMATLPKSKSITIDYNEFCRAPKALYDELRIKLAKEGVNISPSYYGASSYDVSEVVRLPSTQAAELREAVIAYSYA